MWQCTTIQGHIRQCNACRVMYLVAEAVAVAEKARVAAAAVDDDLGGETNGEHRAFRSRYECARGRRTVVVVTDSNGSAAPRLSNRRWRSVGACALCCHRMPSRDESARAGFFRRTFCWRHIAHASVRARHTIVSPPSTAIQARHLGQRPAPPACSQRRARHLGESAPWRACTPPPTPSVYATTRQPHLSPLSSVVLLLLPRRAARGSGSRSASSSARARSTASRRSRCSRGRSRT